MTEPASGDVRPLVTSAVTRGVRRALADRGMAAVAEVTLPNGRRADVLAFDGAGTIWIVEVKSGPPDFQADQKWPEYRDWCDAFHFAVAADFPLDVLPADCGLFVGDGYGADLLRPAPVARLAPARRRALLLLAAAVAAQRLHRLEDPGLAIG